MYKRTILLFNLFSLSLSHTLHNYFSKFYYYYHADINNLNGNQSFSIISMHAIINLYFLINIVAYKMRIMSSSEDIITAVQVMSGWLVALRPALVRYCKSLKSIVYKKVNFYLHYIMTL